MSRKYRFCDVCRGDLDLIECTGCYKKFHIECLDREDYPAGKIHTINSSTWICKDCEDGVQTTSLCQDRMKKVKAFHQDILRSRAAFFKETRSYLQPFCSADNSLDRLINKYGGGNAASTKASSSSSKKSISKATSTKSSSSISCSTTTSNDDPNATATISSPRGLCNEVMTEFSRYESPDYIKGELREYQFDGVSRMFSWFSRGIGGILADEMGLGKTLQTITLLASMKHKLEVEGPHLIITPLAVLQNWANELNRFAPSLTFKKIYGSISERCTVLSDETVLSGSYDVYLTTYETVMCEESFFCDSWTWATVTIDEGHRIKNENAKLRKTLNRIRCPLRILLTGTPVQNDLHELWALLNYILPEVFATSTVFDEGAKIKDDSVNQATCKRARDVLDQFMIRRVKKDVEKSLLPKKHCVLYVHMTSLQKRWYRSVIEQSRCLDKSAAMMMTSQQFMHAFSQLNKIVNHPKQILNKRELERRQEMNRMEKAAYSGSEFIKPRFDLLAPDPQSALGRAEAELRACRGTALIQSSAKLATLDRLLLRLRQQSSRVLVFSQWTETLDILQEYVTFRFGGLGKVFLRLDGQTNSIVREIDVRKFNRDMSVFIYLISTKAGGMGINLATADSVVLFDSCWNPQVDLQAEDRAHRIGQKKQVTIYRLVTADSFEEKLKDMADRKLILNHMVVTSSIGGNNNINSSSSSSSADDTTTAAATAGSSTSYEESLVTGLSEHMTLSQMSELLGFGMDKINNASRSNSNNSSSSNNSDGDTEMTVAEIDDAIEAAISGKMIITAKANNDIVVATDNGTGTSSSSYRNPIALDEDDDNGDDAEKNEKATKGIIKTDDNTNNDNNAADGDKITEVQVEEERNLFSTALSISSNRNSSDDLLVTSSNSSSSNSNSTVPPVLSESILDVFPSLEPNQILLLPSSTSSSSSSSFAPLIENNNVTSSSSSSSSSSSFAVTIQATTTTTTTTTTTEPSYHENGRSRRAVKQTKRYQPAEFLPSTAGNKKMKKTRESFCFECEDGGTLIECNCCPKAYHLECVGLKEVPKKSWTCPWHSCMECDRSSSNSGGMQFRCMTCPIAYCFDCWPKDQEMQNIEPTVALQHSFLKHGFEIPKSSIFFECPDCVVTREKKEAEMKIQQKAAAEAKLKYQKQMEEYVKRQHEIRVKQQQVMQQQREFAQRLQYAEIMSRQQQQQQQSLSPYSVNGGIANGSSGCGNMNMHMMNTQSSAPFQFRPSPAYNQPSQQPHPHHLQQQQRLLPTGYNHLKYTGSGHIIPTNSNQQLQLLSSPRSHSSILYPSQNNMSLQQAQQLQQQMLRVQQPSSHQQSQPQLSPRDTIISVNGCSGSSIGGVISSPSSLPRFDNYVEQQQHKTNSFFPLENVSAYLKGYQQQRTNATTTSSTSTVQKFENYLEQTATSALPK